MRGNATNIKEDTNLSLTRLERKKKSDQQNKM